MDSGCDVHFTKNRCWLSKDDGKDLDMIRSGGVFFVAARPSKLSSKEANTLELNPTTAAEVEQAALAREDAAFGTPRPGTRATLDGDGEPAVRIKVPTGPATPSAEERALHEASGHVPYRSWCQWCIAARVPRSESDFADLERVMYKYTSVPTGNLDQRWGHGIWVGKAPLTDEHIILTENGVQKAKSLLDQ